MQLSYIIAWLKYGWTWKIILSFFSQLILVAEVEPFQSLPGQLWSPLSILRISRWRSRWLPFSGFSHNFYCIQVWLAILVSNICLGPWNALKPSMRFDWVYLRITEVQDGVHVGHQLRVLVTTAILLSPGWWFWCQPYVSRIMEFIVTIYKVWLPLPFFKFQHNLCCKELICIRKLMVSVKWLTCLLIGQLLILRGIYQGDMYYICNSNNIQLKYFFI